MFEHRCLKRRAAAARVAGAVILAGVAGCGAGGVGGAQTSSPVVPGIVVSGAAQTRLGTTTQFSASVDGVSWQVNGITGGSAATGTISATGLYTPPVTLPNPNTVTIGAVNSKSNGTLSEAIWNPVPTVTSVAATQSGTSLSYLLDVRGTSFVSGAQIEVSGTPIPTTVISATELQATYTVAAGTTTLSLNAVNPDPGGATSGAVSASVTTVPLGVPRAVSTV